MTPKTILNIRVGDDSTRPDGSFQSWAHQDWLPWPAPALLVWLLAWLVWAGMTYLGAGPVWASLLSTALGLASAIGWPAISRWRRVFLAAGFPASVLGSGLAAGVPAWTWLLPLALLLLAYPIKAWRDAPLFPTPAQALDGLAPLLALPDGPRVLDAGCGLGHGLAALRGQWPDAQLTGHEWSWPLALAARWRIWRAGIQADVRRADMWGRCWAGQDLVYVFQRPESMARVWQKARGELAPGAWLVSLEFEVQGVAPTFSLPAGPSRTLWAYQMQQGMQAPHSTLPACGR